MTNDSPMTPQPEPETPAPNCFQHQDGEEHGLLTLYCECGAMSVTIPDGTRITAMSNGRRPRYELEAALAEQQETIIALMQKLALAESHAPREEDTSRFGYREVARLFHNALVGQGRAGLFNNVLCEEAVHLYDELEAKHAPHLLAPDDVEWIRSWRGRAETAEAELASLRASAPRPHPQEARRYSIEDIDQIVAGITAVVREADEGFQKSGGTSRHWARDWFLPLLYQHGWRLEKQDDPAAGEALGPRQESGK